MNLFFNIGHRSLFLVSILLVSFSCRNPEGRKKFKIGFSQCTFGDVWRQTMQKEMERELAFHPEMELLVKDANLSSEKQKAQIEELIAEKVDLLIASPAEAEPIAPVIGKAYAAGIPVILVDRNTLSKNYTAFIGANNYKIGLDAGAYATTLLKGQGHVLEIAGPDVGSSADIGRHKGFTDFIKKYPGIHYVSRFNADWDKHPEEWERQFTNVLKPLTDVQFIFSQNDRLAFAASKVCRRLGLGQKIKIIGVDGLPGENGGIDLVEKGILKATILYPTGGKEAIQTAASILRGQPYQKEAELSTTIIDSANVRIMRLQNEKVLAQQMDIDRSQKKIEAQNLITQNQTNIIYAISITLALALIMGSVLFFYLRENKKINARLAGQNEEIISQRNQLLELGKKAKEATDAKFNFFTNISHEIRTPLTLILGPLEEAVASPKLHFSIKAPLEMVKKNSIRLLRLVNQLMDFRKIEEAKMQLRASENNITEFITEITNAFAEMAHKKKISFRVDSKDTALKVWFDVNMLDKILFNILSNAFKYTADYGAVTVLVSRDESHVMIRVEDSGVGMGPETLEHAFDLFYQGNEGAYKGTGLGLALSKELVTLHHGTIKIKSEKWKGATFEITLPLGKAHLHNNELVKETVPYFINYEEAKIYTTEADVIKVFYPEEATATAKEHSILLIEDNADIRTFLKSHLGKNYELIEAENGNLGLNLAYETVPDIIISDILLPGKDGREITNVLKNDIRTSHIPIIILTAKGSIEQQIEGLKLKADAYIVKPFSVQYLEENIKNLIRNRESLRDHYSSELANESQRTFSSKKIDRRFVSEFSAIVENNITNENFGVDDLCKEIGISRVQLYRKVKAVLGLNVNDYILSVRMQRAKYLLLNEDLSISEISSKVGFSSQAYFSTVFKSKFGVTPKAFKESK